MAKGKAGAPLGNQNGAKGKMFLMQLRNLITEDELTLPEKKRRLRLAAGKLLSTAAEGESWAIKELADRLDGKAVQGVEVANPDGSAINFFDAGQIRGMTQSELVQLKTLLTKAGKASK